MQENASHVILLPPLSTGQVRPAVMRCAKQRDCAPVHILPYLSSHVHMFLEVIFIICKCVLSFHIRKAPHIIVRCLFYYIPINIDTREMNPIIMSPTAIAHPILKVSLEIKIGHKKASTGKIGTCF